MVYQWIIAAITLLVPALAGIMIVSYLNILKEKISIITVGSVLGIAIYATLSYACIQILPLSTMSIYAVLAVVFCVVLIMAWRDDWKHFRTAKLDKTALALLVIFLILFAVIGSKLLVENKDGLSTGIINAYGDIGWHTAMINELAEQRTLPLRNPIFAGHNLTYPFLSNLLSASMVVLGASVAASVNVPAIILIPITLLLTYFVGKTYGRSKGAGILMCILFLFGGATFGWIRVGSDFAASGVSLGEFLTHLPARDYSGVGTDTEGFHFLNPISTLLLPQRPMLFGMPILLSAILLLHPAIIKRKYAAIVAGALAGMLPLFHAHACIALTAACVALFITSKDKKRWISFAAPALAIGIPELVFYMNGQAEAGSFFRYGPGWMAGTRNQVLYWLQNTGLLIPVSIVALFTRAPKSAKALAIAGTFLFLLADTFLFAPWEWDNFKIFVFWLLFIMPIVAWSIRALWKSKHGAYLQVAICIIVAIHVASAAFDITKLALPTARIWGEWDPQGIEIAQAIKTYVPAPVYLLTAPVHNSPGALSGRTIFLGYAPHVWSHGGLPWDREKEIKAFYLGQTNTVEGLRPKYVLVGPQERSLGEVLIRPEWEEIATAGSYTLFSDSSVSVPASR